MNRMSRRWIWLAAGLLVAAGPLRAQEAPQEAAQEAPLVGMLPDSIVVTASRQAERVRQTGRRVTVLTARDLAALPVASFDELLRAVGGVEVQSRGGFGVQSDLTMRGSTFNGVLLLLDGARLNDPMTGHFLADLPVPLSEIARIEVLRGPAASLYGPDALGGVIQIFTHAGLQQGPPARQGTSAEARLDGGRHALYQADVAVRRATDRRLVSLAASAAGTDGQPIEGPDGRLVRRSDGEAIRTDFRRAAATLAATHAFDAATLFVRAGLDDRDFGAYQFYTGFASDTAREATTTAWMQARLQGRAAATTDYVVELALKQHHDAYRYNPASRPSEHVSRLGTLQARLTRRFTPRLRGTAGISGSLRGIDSNVMQVHHDGAMGVYATLQALLTPRLTAHLSSRLDVDPSYGAEPTPQLNLAYTAGRVTLRGGVGRAVRAPNYVERYLDAGGNVGNPDLEAERAWAAEAGADLYPAASVSLHATAFYRATDNLIDYVLVPGERVFRAENLLRVDTRGLELDAEVTRPLGAARLHLAGAYTYLDADVETELPPDRYKYALGHARHLVQGRATLGLGRVSLGVQGLWKDRLVQDSYGLVHARLGYRLRLGPSVLTLSGEVRNVFDTRIAEIFNAPLPGRWWIVGLAWGR